MRTTRRIAAACAAATLTVLSATSAVADDLDNDLDLGVDATHESMTLQYDDLDGIAGPSATTTLSIIVEDMNEGGDTFNNCNLPGNHSVTLVATYDPAVVAVSLSDGGVIDDCTDTIVATVTPVHSGTTPVTISGVNTSNDHAPFDRMDYSGGDFDVTVNNVDLGDGTGGGGNVCDADPAAPAWAAALLKGNNVKAKAGGLANYISAVARHMGNGATFDGHVKSADEYPHAVHAWMVAELGLTLANGPAAVARPGWECTDLQAPSL